MDPFEKERQETESSRYGVSYELSVADAVKTISGEAICHTQGVLGLKGGVADVFKRDEDLRRGVSFSQDGFTDVVTVRIIGETGEDPAKLAATVQNHIESALQKGAGMENLKVCVEVADMMSKEEFLDKYGPDRSCECATQ